MTLKHYKVTWEIDIEEEDPWAAAEQAWEIMGASDSKANVFEVYDEKGTHFHVDLEKSHHVGNRSPIKCDKCGLEMENAPELDRPFDQETFGGEGIWMAFRCKNGHVAWEPLD